MEHEFIAQFERAKEVALDMAQHLEGMPIGTGMMSLAILVAASLDQVATHEGQAEAASMLRDFPKVVQSLTESSNAYVAQQRQHDAA